MSRYRHEIDNARAHIISLWLVIMLLAGALAYAFHGWSAAPEDITVHVPPDLSAGASLSLGEIPKPNLYAFGFYMWQQLNRWPKDGAEDYAKNLYRFAAYITPSFRADLLRDMNRRGRQGELSSRVRALFEDPDAMYEEGRVQPVADGVWIVTLDTIIEESVSGMEVKRTRIRYPLRVVRYDVDRERNPWGLALDGFAGGGPIKLDTQTKGKDTP